MYKEALVQFGGLTSNLPEGGLAFDQLSWLKAHVQKLPSFVGWAIDYDALAGATNYAKMLVRRGCGHIEGVKKEKLSGPSDLIVISPSLRKSIWNFVSSF